MLDAATISSLAVALDEAQINACAIAKLTDSYPDMSLEEAYAVQEELCRRWQARGRRAAGYKAGATSKAKMLQMNVKEPSFGALMRDTCCPDGTTIRSAELIHPRIEAELAIVTKYELEGPGRSIDDVLKATDFFQPAFEVIDSRYEGFKLDLVSAIADNSSSARFVLGGRRCRIEEIDLCGTQVVLERNDQIVGIGATSAVLGNPVNAVVMLIDWLARRGRALPAGSIVLSGAVTEAIAVSPGDRVRAHYQNMGSVSLRFD